MKLKYLGTAAAEGIPAVWCNCEVCRKARKIRGKDVRTRSQVLINEDLMVDFPQDAYMHMLRDDLDFAKLKYVIFTHSHQDHFYPEEFAMRSKGYANHIDFPVQVYGNDFVVKRLQATDEMSIPERVETHEVKNFEEFTIGDYKITPLTADHDPRENCLFYIIKNKDKTILYSNDTGEYPQDTWDYLEKTKPHFDLISMDCTIGFKKSDRYHMGIPNILHVRDRLRQAGIVSDKTVTIATHFSHNFYTFYDEAAEEMKKLNIIPTYDGMEVEI